MTTGPQRLSIAWTRAVATAWALACGPSLAETEAEYATPPVGGRLLPPNVRGAFPPGWPQPVRLPPSPAVTPRPQAAALPAGRAAAPRQPAAPRPAPAVTVPYAPEAMRTVARLAPDRLRERGFLQAAAAAARFELEALRLAAGRTHDPVLRGHIAASAAEGEAVLRDLARLLHARGMALPMLDDAHRRLLTRLGKLSGAGFDREYQQQVSLGLGREMLRGYQRAGAAVTEPALRSWVQARLPVMQARLAAAERIATGEGQAVLRASATTGRAVPTAAAPSSR
ncbi:DUF4142 domain-containing protein [Ramlibacter tataouinensis]|uniref:DUF4142 domain-containing protein n=1 Tax=Ramlibacter tataouinensis (strain ATCC BAA-407 / DSM 14655 / LMG 21543 / TTB310) TaxID=365046 RepID=F5Y2L7_RAMTT|nr:DUF4142 domain-containing protein [Ramlibacter tataouinensis]AEG92380.1 hypothetical protein Rta_12930 [Ramlibacter tataouinensis TTB310]